MAEGPHIGRWEILGAWLRVWTPPRGVTVPPVPWRRLALSALVGAALLGAVIAWAAPRIRSGVATRERSAAAGHARLGRAEQRRLAAEQVVHEGRALPPPLHTEAGASRAGRTRLLAAVRRTVDADARRRVQSGLMRGPILRTSCAPFPPTASGVRPEANPDQRVARYECLAVTSDIMRDGARAGALGHPFRVRVDFRSGRFAWCKANLRPGEGNAGREVASVPLSRRCAG